MKKNSILVDSGYGSYLKGDQPRAIANEFLYYNPNILLWVDEFYCDKNAMKAEEQDAMDGFLVSEFSIELRKKKIIVEKDFSVYFTPEVSARLIAESDSDLIIAEQKNLMPYVIPEINSSASQSRNRFFDINALLLLSAELDISFLNTKPSINYFHWKFEKWNEQFLQANLSLEETRSLISFNHVMDIFVPNLTVFPKTKLLKLAENAKSEMINISYQFGLGNTNRQTLEKAYHKFMKAYLKYDSSVKSEAQDNLATLLAFRADKRLVSLRNFIEEFSAKLTQDDTDLIYKEVQAKFKKELLLIESAIISETKETDWIDKYGAYLSFPVNALMVTLTAVTNNPLYTFFGLYTNLITSSNQLTKDVINRKYLWKSYLHSMKEQVDRSERLRQLDKEIAKYEKIK